MRSRESCWFPRTVSCSPFFLCFLTAIMLLLAESPVSASAPLRCYPRNPADLNNCAESSASFTPTPRRPVDRRTALDQQHRLARMARVPTQQQSPLIFIKTLVLLCEEKTVSFRICLLQRGPPGNMWTACTAGKTCLLAAAPNLPCLGPTRTEAPGVETSSHAGLVGTVFSKYFGHVWGCSI